MSHIEEFTFVKTITIKLADSDGKGIRVGSVLKNIEDGDRGVVTAIGRAGDVQPAFCTGLPLCVGDIVIRTSAGTRRVTNRYSVWKHISHNDQTYEERYQSWLCDAYDHDECQGVSEDIGLAIDGIMNLLPDNIVDWEYGPWPDSLEDTLKFLIAHMENIEKKK